MVSLERVDNVSFLYISLGLIREGYIECFVFFTTCILCYIFFSDAFFKKIDRFYIAKFFRGNLLKFRD